MLGLYTTKLFNAHDFSVILVESLHECKVFNALLSVACSPNGCFQWSSLLDILDDGIYISHRTIDYFNCLKVLDWKPFRLYSK